MKNNRIVKTLIIAALSSVTLIAGASQANSWGHYEKAYAPYTNYHPGFDRPTFRDHPQVNYKQHDVRYDIDSRQQILVEKIMHGVRAGSLSESEARKLMREQREIEQLQRHFMADRHLSRNEWRELDHRLDIAAREIRTEKRDNNWR